MDLSDGRKDGMCDGNVLGSYLHGFFDSDDLRCRLVNMIANKKGLNITSKAINDDIKALDEYKENEYNRLADMVRASLDMKAIYNIMGIN